MAEAGIELLRDPKTGYLYAYKNGKLAGPIAAMNENPPKKPSCDLIEYYKAQGNG